MFSRYFIIPDTAAGLAFSRFVRKFSLYARNQAASFAEGPSGSRRISARFIGSLPDLSPRIQQETPSKRRKEKGICSHFFPRGGFRFALAAAAAASSKCFPWTRTRGGMARRPSKRTAPGGREQRAGFPESSALSTAGSAAALHSKVIIFSIWT